MKRKSFTLIELIVVIVVLAIVSSITFDILAKLYRHYVFTREMNKLNTKLDYTMEIIGNRLRDRIRNSVIITKYPKTLSDSDEDKVDFKPIGELDDGDEKYYKIIEWIGKDYEAKNGMWDYRTKHIQTAWSGFIDLGYNSHKTQDNPKEFNVTTPDSNFTMMRLIDENITKSYGINVKNTFEENYTTLIFSGIDQGGDIVEDLNESYGWYLNPDKERKAKAIFAILQYRDYVNVNATETELNITSISENNDTSLYSRYFITRSAYALVPIENNETLPNGKKINDYNLTFVYNYQPWRGDWWNGNDGTTGSGKGEVNRTLLATHVTEIRFKKDRNTHIIRLYLCIQSPNVEINSTRNLTLCKEKAIF